VQEVERCVVLLALSAAAVLAAPTRTARPRDAIGRIDIIDAGSTVVRYQGGSRDLKNTYTSTDRCGECLLKENDVLDITRGTATFSIFNAQGQWTCGPNINLQLHAADFQIRTGGAQCRDMRRIQFEGVPVGPDNIAEWTNRYQPDNADPKSVSGMMAGGLILEKLGRYRDAREQYRRAHQIFQTSDWIQRQLDRVTSLAEQAEGGPRQAPRTLAVVIGASEYLWHPALQLRGAAADASWFAAYLASPKGGSIPDPDVTKLIDERATVSAVRGALRDALRIKARPGDTVFIYVAGHAVQKTQEAFLVGYDGRLEEPRTLYPLDDLRQMAQDAGRIGVRVILFTDVCHAGSIETGKRGRRTMLPAALDEKYFVEKNVWGIAASGPGELAAELPVEGHADHLHGVFTRYLIEGLHSSPERISNTALWNYVRDRMSKDPNVHRQRPLQLGADIQPFDISRAVAQPVVPHPDAAAPQGMERFSAGQPRAEWLRIKDATGDDAQPQRNRFSVRLDIAGDALLNEYLSGGEIPQSPSDFDVGTEIYSVLREMAATGTVLQDTPLIEVRARFFEAMRLLRGGKSSNASQAVKLLDQALEWDQTAGYIYNARGQAYAQARDLKEAKSSFQDAILLNPDWAYPRHNLAVIHEVEAQDDRAARLYQEAIGRALMTGSSPASTYYNFARLLHARNDLAAAREYYHLAQEAFHALTTSYDALAARCHGDGCSTYARIADGVRTGEMQTWNALGILDHDDRNDRLAMTDYEKGQKLQAAATGDGAMVASNIQFNLIKLKTLAQKNGQTQRLASLEALLEQKKDYAPALFELAILHQRQNPASKEAEAEFRRLTELEPGAGQGWRGLLETLLAERRFEEAQDTLRLAMEQLDTESYQELRRVLDHETTKRVR
jgi:tetratricopeptide (TPR) repeat protein